MPFYLFLKFFKHLYIYKATTFRIIHEVIQHPKILMVMYNTHTHTIFSCGPYPSYNRYINTKTLRFGSRLSSVFKQETPNLTGPLDHAFYW